METRKWRFQDLTRLIKSQKGSMEVELQAEQGLGREAQEQADLPKIKDKPTDEDQMELKMASEDNRMWQPIDFMKMNTPLSLKEY
ncbi:uncharacterized protein N7482_006719 [Penicillium canariense]|uniref:Uncharacterized protein n=1 Tax=Penicillium canariense TaxID=189055 RepID=A0A9W9I069_9EURO|nr:uncharacterized protein N7482_006719 [Penicillium canariense]KAJ5159715.1 hypothetical protein N7482_006719 [Penicillium canariense]